MGYPSPVAFPEGEMIPFNRPHLTGREFANIQEAHAAGQLAGDGAFTRRCSETLQSQLNVCRALLTHSATAALEMTALLLDVGPGDEVVMPSYTFVSTANAFVLRGATPVFVDIRDDTQNLDESKLADALSPRTKAIVPVHYAGVPCEMAKILSTAEEAGVSVVEDAAQAIYSTYKGRFAGTLGRFGCLSFHETKNVVSGEGGALLISSRDDEALAEVVREKGTDRSSFFRGEIDRYTWQGLGSSFLPGELTAAFLSAQLEEGSSITEQRLAIWNDYRSGLEGLEKDGLVQLPFIPRECTHNGHMFYLKLPDLQVRSALIEFLRQRSISAVFHYVPLHDSPMGRRYGRTVGTLTNTNSTAERLVRLPLWPGIETQLDRIITSVHDFFRGQRWH